MNHPHYRTDTGDAQKGDFYSRGQKKLGNQSGPNAITLEEAIIMFRQLRGTPMLLVKTSWRSDKRPGAFYAKAFVSKGADRNELIRVMNNNQLNGIHTPREAWIL